MEWNVVQPCRNPLHVAFAPQTVQPRSMTRKAILPILFAAVHCIRASGQEPAATLSIELQNVVEYQVDTSDLSKWGTNPNSTSGKILQGTGVGCSGVPVYAYGDIVSVNGEIVRGTYFGRALSVCTSPTPAAGLNEIADVSANSLRDETYYILQSDGVTPIGTIMVNGLNGSVSPKPPGPPPGGQNFAIVGGTGAYLGARGQKGSGNGGLTGLRLGSITEDPANRRQNGGGHGFFTFYVIPMFRPEVVITANARHHSFQRLFAGKHLQARRGGRDFVPIRHRPWTHAYKFASGPAVPIEPSCGGQLAGRSDGEWEACRGAECDRVSRRDRRIPGELSPACGYGKRNGGRPAGRSLDSRHVRQHYSSMTR
jgi:hypothetical protein